MVAGGWCGDRRGTGSDGYRVWVSICGHEDGLKLTVAVCTGL